MLCAVIASPRWARTPSRPDRHHGHQHRQLCKVVIVAGDERTRRWVVARRFLSKKPLSALLDKAEAFAAAKKIDPVVLLRTRLAPDMFDFTRQVQTVSDQARRGAGI
jgi:hypothetical protein